MTPDGAAPSVTKAWAGLLANALVLPGLGSVLTGRWISGLLQAAASLIGFAMTAHWAFAWLEQVLREGLLTVDGPGPRFGYGLAGLLLFGCAWLWSVASSVVLVQRARRRLSGA